MEQKESLINSNVSMLGKLLGNTIKEALGNDSYELVESIRRLSKMAAKGDDEAQLKLVHTLQNLKDDEFLPVAQAFNQFLNLTNTAEQYDSISPHAAGAINPIDFKSIYEKFKERNISDDEIKKAIENISIDLVLTAHPTEVNRRSLINNLNAVTDCLTLLDHNDLVDYKRQQIMDRLRQLITQYWFTVEIRKNRPTPNEEAKWGYDVIEHSLWKAVPTFIRELSEQTEKSINYKIPIDARPIHFTSWMGGDRDGNPNVTAEVTSNVLLNSRKRAAKLFLSDIETLVRELSMFDCTQELKDYIGNVDVQEPYREVVRAIRIKLKKTITYLDDKIEGRKSLISKHETIYDNAQLWNPLYECYKSLVKCRMESIANDNLLNTLRRIKCFGVTLAQIDIRQESTRHTEAIAEITNYIGLGDYASWSEEEKQAFLVKELSSKRPLIPQDWNPSEATKEVLDTCKVIADTPKGVITAYVISMTRTPSDILAVHLLLKESNCPYVLPVAPLFETLNDLHNAESVMKQLFSINWYRNIIEDKQMVMIGYSDSAKDAGALSAGWAQYTAQESLIKLCDKNRILLTLFHGRGGTIGRGGGPAKVALFSQPPGSLQGGLRVTEQGEMIRFKLGLPDLVIQTLANYVDAMLEANILPPPEPKKEWRKVMDEISDISCKSYQALVHHNEDFIPYFYQATPEAELAKLPLGSRPAKRKATGGVENLRAIPWIFGWSQNRLMLPAWLGAGEALQTIIDRGDMGMLEKMYTEWPFFNTRISMLEMVFSKSNITIAEYYDKRLVEKHLLYLGVKLRDQLQKDTKTILNIAHDKSLMQNLPSIASNIKMRNIYTIPLNLLQVELLHRCRNMKHSSQNLEMALMITISGIAAGMRNTG